MSLDLALRLTEILLALALIQQSLEHLRGQQDERPLFLPLIILSALLMTGIAQPWICLALFINALFILKRFQGPYNGGADRMTLLILSCLTLAHFMPSPRWQEYIFGYLALQLVLSYFMSGWVKITNPEWRKGRALQDVFAFSAYPVSESLRNWAMRPQILFLMSWAVMGFELAFPLALITQPTLILALILASTFHLANACLFGLNRFFWIWIAAYPALLWLQYRIFEIDDLNGSLKLITALN